MWNGWVTATLTKRQFFLVFVLLCFVLFLFIVFVLFLFFLVCFYFVHGLTVVGTVLMFGCPNFAVRFSTCCGWTGKTIGHYLGFSSFLLSRNTFCGIGLHFLFAFIFFLSGRDKITNMIFRLFPVYLYPLMRLRLLFHLFLINKDQNHTYFFKIWVVPKRNVIFVSFSLSIFFSSRCITPLLCLKVLLSHQEGSKVNVEYFFARATAFLTILVRLTREVLRICIVLIALMLVWFESLLSWNGPRARYQVVLSLVSLLPLGSIKTHN